jgi:hypothetical protein
VKLNSVTGEAVWANKSTNTTPTPDLSTIVSPLSITTDCAGSVYVSGSLGLTTDDVPGPAAATFGSTTLTFDLPAISNAFIAKAAASTGAWQAAIGTMVLPPLSFFPPPSVTSTGLVADCAGALIISGAFAGTVQLGSTTLSTAANNQLGSMYVAKIDTNLSTWQWAVSSSSPSDTGLFISTAAHAVATDCKRNVYITGTYNGPVTFGGQSFSNPFATAVFVAKLSPNGGFVGTISQSTAGDPAALAEVSATGLVTNCQGNIFSTGSFTRGTLTFGSTTLAADASTTSYFITSVVSDPTVSLTGTSLTDAAVGTCVPASAIRFHAARSSGNVFRNLIPGYQYVSNLARTSHCCGRRSRRSRRSSSNTPGVPACRCSFCSSSCSAYVGTACSPCNMLLFSPHECPLRRREFMDSHADLCIHGPWPWAFAGVR